MTAAELLKELEKHGSEQTRKTYARHGVTGKQFGVSYAVLKPLAKKIKTNHVLAKQLWESGVHDARILALMIADPAAADAALLDRWAKSTATNYVMADAVAEYAAKTGLADKEMRQWMSSDDEFLCAAGWNTAARLVTREDAMSDEQVQQLLDTIEHKIHSSKNRVRHSMNGALISIGARNGNFQSKAIAAAGRIGKVQVDHGDTNCTTPDAAEYIRKRAKAKPRK